MSIKCSVYIAASVDGFIAAADGDIGWLHRPEYASAPVAGLSYEDFIATVDTLVMGRKTFETVLTFEAWPYEGVPVVVLSSRKLDVPAALRGKARLAQGAPGEIVARLAAEGRRHLYIDGGLTVQQFIQDGLIDEITITRIPILLGRGISLFGSIGREVALRHLETHISSSGLVQTRYRVAYDA